jgi:cytochrome c-type biogenesis protein CcmH/NrfF
MGEHTALLWTWYVNAKHPNSGLFLTAEIVTKLSDGHVESNELALSISVNRTLQYTLFQIFTNWATWSAIVVAAVTGGGFLWKRRQKRAKNKSKNKKKKNARKPSRRPSVAPDR